MSGFALSFAANIFLMIVYDFCLLSAQLLAINASSSSFIIPSLSVAAVACLVAVEMCLPGIA
jgi:hypothetical protein